LLPVLGSSLDVRIAVSGSFCVIQNLSQQELFAITCSSEDGVVILLALWQLSFWFYRQRFACMPGGSSLVVNVAAG
jgi:hypothetical protein